MENLKQKEDLLNIQNLPKWKYESRKPGPTIRSVSIKNRVIRRSSEFQNFISELYQAFRDEIKLFPSCCQTFKIIQWNIVIAKIRQPSLVKIIAEILKKFSKLNLVPMKKINHHDQFGFIPGVQGCFSYPNQ